MSDRRFAKRYDGVKGELFDLKRVPPEVLVLTCDVDVQHNRLEAVAVGHGRAETFGLDQRIFCVPPNASYEPWRELPSTSGSTGVI